MAAPYNVRILDTRKTIPGLRLFEKYAVTVGGGWNHRLDLSSGILIKDNHIQAAGGITNAVNKIRKKNYNLPIELEVENLKQIKEGLNAGVDGFLLDNMTPVNIRKCVSIIRSHPNGKTIFIEASGGITLKTLPDYVNTGIDAVSVGALTHSAKAANIHIEFE
jgi:nicotinate-nucleotide pyrophosphorylase (carboxylating)